MIEQEAVAFARNLTRGLLRNQDGTAGPDPEVIGLVHPRRQYVVGLLRAPSVDGSTPMTVYAVVLLRNSTTGYIAIGGVTACDHARRGIAFVYPVPGPDVVLAADVQRAFETNFASTIAIPNSIGVQAWLDPLRHDDEPGIALAGSNDEPASFCPRPKL